MSPEEEQAERVYIQSGAGSPYGNMGSNQLRLGVLYGSNICHAFAAQVKEENTGPAIIPCDEQQNPIAGPAFWQPDTPGKLSRLLGLVDAFFGIKEPK